MRSTSQPRSAYATDAARWQAVSARDPAADGHFVYAVRTTGVYGHPSSWGRLPKRQNVEFFDSVEAAEAAGYRPSRRVQGDRTSTAITRARLAAQACRLIESASSPPSLDKLAAHLNMSPFYFHRLFKAETGLTPKAYASAYRAGKLRKQLGTAQASVTEAIYEAGFNSNSRFYEASEQLLGMPPRAYRAGGAGTVIRFAIGQCSLGAILVAQSEQGVCAISLGDDPDVLLRQLQDRFPKAQLLGGDQGFERLVAQVVGFIEAPAIGLNLPLDIRGTAFQERVWQALREIPVGTTATYADIAKRIGAPKAVRAVGSACGANPIAVAIPCHRVLRHDGGISGYRWGVERKRELLRREADATATAKSSSAPQAPAAVSVTDVVAQLEQKAAANPQKLNWRTSIVDLLKLLDLDSSLTARKELATELGCPADLMGDSAQMNMWLHKTVLARIAQNGGNIPQDLLD